MISPEFRMAVDSKNLLRVRIMLKDSFIVDPTLAQFNEMQDYAKRKLPDLFIPFDHGILEDNPLKWDKTVMNMELVQLVNNFSKERVAHLKKVVIKVLEKEVGLKQEGKSEQRKSQETQKTKLENKKNALTTISRESKKIRIVLDEIETSDDKWSPSKVNKVEQAAKEILKAVQIYEANK